MLSVAGHPVALSESSSSISGTGANQIQYSLHPREQFEIRFSIALDVIRRF
jgi:hypothetical protein